MDDVSRRLAGGGGARVRSGLPRAIARALALAALAACSSGDPPFAELPLRDALTADPEVLAAMPEASRRELGERLEEARRAQQAAEPADLPSGAPADLVRVADEARAIRGDDALVAVSVRQSAETWTIEAVPSLRRAPAVDEASPAPLPPLAGGATASTASLEQQALEGRAGAVIHDLLRTSGARRLVRVTAWPAGAVAAGDAVYVNAAWLVALAPPGDGARRPGPVVYTPLSVGGNPYLTYGSLEACAADVSKRCSACLASGACDPRPTLQDFADARAECAFLGQDPARPNELCALALLSIGAVGECVRSAAPSCSLPSASATGGSLPLAASFVANALCVQALDICLSGAPPSPAAVDAGTLAVSLPEPKCEDPFSACASSFKGLGDSCKSGSCSAGSHASCTSCSSCKSTNGSSCDSCKGSGGSTTGSSSSSSSCNSCKSGTGGSTSGSSSSSNCKCQTEGASPAPVGDLVWLLAPLGYVLARARRPS